VGDNFRISAIWEDAVFGVFSLWSLKEAPQSIDWGASWSSLAFEMVLNEPLPSSWEATIEKVDYFLVAHFVGVF
jgi:hypothetical protein